MGEEWFLLPEGSQEEGHLRVVSECSVPASPVARGERMRSLSVRGEREVKVSFPVFVSKEEVCAAAMGVFALPSSAGECLSTLWMWWVRERELFALATVLLPARVCACLRGNAGVCGACAHVLALLSRVFLPRLQYFLPAPLLLRY